MRIASYLLPDGQASFGLVENETIKDCGDEYRTRFPDLASVICDGDLEGLAKAAEISASTPFADVRFLPPIPKPDKVICIGLNYMAHIKETGREVPKHPSVFTRYSSSVVGQNVDMVKPMASDWFDYEGELAVIIGRECRHVSPNVAMSYVAGYSCFNDGSVRDFQKHTTQFWPGKNFHQSGSMGPWMVTSDDIPDPTVLEMVTRLNGETVQSAPISDLAFDIPALISYLSTVTILLPGDVIATGTPSGVGLYREPKLFMKPGDVVEVEISKIGILSNTVVAET